MPADLVYFPAAPAAPLSVFKLNLFWNQFITQNSGCQNYLDYMDMVLVVIVTDKLPFFYNKKIMFYMTVSMYR